MIFLNGFFRLSLFLVISPILISEALQCACNTDRGEAACIEGICRVEIDSSKFDQDSDEELVLPCCVVVRHPTYGDIYSCSYAAAKGSFSRRCTVSYVNKNVSFDQCWCNSGDFCNRDLLIPKDDDHDYDEDDEEEEQEDRKISSTAKNIPSTAAITSTSEAISSNAAQISSTAIFQFQSSTDLEEEATSDEEDSNENISSIGTFTGDEKHSTPETQSSRETEKRWMDEISSAQQNDEQSSSEKEIFRSSIDTGGTVLEFASTTPMTEKNVEKAEASSTEDYSGAVMAKKGAQCANGDCLRNVQNEKSGNNAKSKSSKNQFWCVLIFLGLCVIAIRAMTAF